MISGIHALTILDPSIEGNLGGDIEGRRAERDDVDAMKVILHSDGYSCMLVLMMSLRPGQHQKLIGSDDRCLTSGRLSRAIEFFCTSSAR